MIDAYVRAFKVAELDDRVARVEQMTDAELMQVIREEQARRVAPAQQPSKLLTLKPR